MASTQNRLHKLFGLDAAHHGRHTPIRASADTNLEVINLGLSRTGTTSICAALETLGYTPSHQGIDTYRSPARRESFIALFQDLNAGRAGSSAAVSARLRHLMQGYRASCDNPINHLAPEVVAAYPDAKYILGVREGGAEAWWVSINNAVGLHFRRDWSRTVFRALIWPVRFLRRIDDKVQEMRMKAERDTGVPWGPLTYEKHNEMVRGLVGEDKLLVYRVQEGWGPLCKFLGVEVPSEPFPMLNEAESMRAIYLGMQMYGAFIWALYAGGFGMAAYLAMNRSVAESWFRKALALYSAALQRVLSR